MYGDTDSISMYWKNDHALKLLQMFGQSLGKVSGHALNKLAPTYLKFGKELNKVNCLVSVCPVPQPNILNVSKWVQQF